MDTQMYIFYFQVVAGISLLLWIGLLLFRGRFWLADQILNSNPTVLDTWPSVAIIIPARNEEGSIEIVLQSLLAQKYPGTLDITIINDDSSDDTVEKITRFKSNKINLLNNSIVPKGWTGKVWALKQGITFIGQNNPCVDYFLFTDADIKHSPDNLTKLVGKAERENLQLVSLMVLLNCESLWERLLIPAFVFFFQKLYPFPWINDPRRTTAGAGGGCILVRRTALEVAGGIDAVRGEIIDDCAIGRMVKNHGPIWLGLTKDIKSLREYNRLSEIWEMVARTAFDQLKYSSLALVSTVLGMGVIYLIPPLAFACGLLLHNYFLAYLGALSWLIMAIAYLPTQRLYQRPVWEAALLPVAALVYSLITLDSAHRYWSKRSTSWKDRKISNNIAR